MLSLILDLFAFVLFVLAALGVPNTTRVNLTAAGLACWVASQLVALSLTVR